MSLCRHRPESPSFWTPCTNCPCGAEVQAEMEAQTTNEGTPA